MLVMITIYNELFYYIHFLNIYDLQNFDFECLYFEVYVF